MPNSQDSSPKKPHQTPQSQTPQSQTLHSVLDHYIICRNQVGGKTALATVTASAMGGWLLFNAPEAGSIQGGITAIAGYCLGTTAVVFIFAFIGPRLRQIMPWGYSLNEYVYHRFSSKKGSKHSSRVFSTLLYWMTIGVMLMYMFVYLGLQLTALSRALNTVFSFPLFDSSIIIATLVFLYTAVGGLKASLWTDKVQVMLILPLLAVCFVAMVVSLGGWNAAVAPVLIKAPELLSWRNFEGLGFAAALLIAFTAAELFNQANWQRVYACKDDQTVRRSFLSSVLVMSPMILVAGLFGIIAAGRNFSGTGAFFDLLLLTSLPTGVAAMVTLLALGLVMSSMDSLFNGITAVFAGEITRYSWTTASNREKTESHALIAARVLTISVALPVVVVALDNSVFYLFFIADVLCSALAFPILFSLFNRHQTTTNAFWSSLAGIAAGGLFLSKPDFTPLFNIPGGGNFLISLAAALFVSTLFTLLWTSIDKRKKGTAPFNYSELRDKSGVDQVLAHR